mmetsp:Transcript_23667/g.73731  ORF Transcript_23667/g.73731 Transcript_23667/m.73731 type:complete len:482 (-) Transcript_23667:47-1492(-)
MAPQPPADALLLLLLLSALAGGVEVWAAAPSGAAGCGSRLQRRPPNVERGRGVGQQSTADDVGLIQVVVSVDSPQAPAVGNVSRRSWRAEALPLNAHWVTQRSWWTGIGPGDDSAVSYPLPKERKTRVTQHPELGRRNHAAVSGLIVGYVGFAAILARVYWKEGIKVIFYVLSYLGALATITISIKHIYAEFDFVYPKIITAFHLLFSALAGFIVLFGRACATGKRMALPTPWEFLSRIFPISLCFGLCVGLANVGLLHMSPLLAEIIGALNPLFSVPLTLLMGLPFRLVLLAPIAVVVAGAITAVQPWDLSVSVGGLVCMILSVIIRSVKSVLQQEVMTGALKERFDEYTLLAWSCWTSCLMMFVWSFISERGEPWEAFANSSRQSALAVSLVVSVLIAILVNISHLWVTKVLGAVSSQLMAQTKSVLVLLGSLAILGERCSTAELIGFGLVLFGTFMYGIVQQNLLFPEGKEEPKTAAA